MVGLPRASRVCGPFHLRRGVSAGAVILALFATVPAAASAAIVPGRAIAGVKLGDTPARLVAVLGKPETVQKNQGEESWFWRQGPVAWVTVRVKGRSKTVEGIETYDRKQRTPKGTGVGSSMRALRKAYPSLTCKRGWLGVTFTSCWILTRVGGREIPTNFVFFEGKPIGAVDIGQIGEHNLAPQP